MRIIWPMPMNLNMPSVEPIAAPAFPYDLPGLFAQTQDLSLLTYTPLGNKIVTDMAINCILKEGLGKDGITDLLAISYSSTDKLGHATGPRSIELEDMYYRLDEEIARLLVELDELVGTDHYLLFITSDHGVVGCTCLFTPFKSQCWVCECGSVGGSSRIGY